MADLQIFKYTGDNHGDKYEIKNAAFSIKTAKNYTDLTTALTINSFSTIDLFDNNFAERFRPFYRGYLQRALGDGLRDIQDYGFAQIRKFEPAKPGDVLCLQVPTERMEREETYGRITRVYSSGRNPDILSAYDKFVNPDELYEFQERKKLQVSRSVSSYLDIMFSYILGICPWGIENADRYNNLTISSILGAKWDDTPLGKFGEDKEGIGAILKSISEDFKDEIDKEKNLSNINVFPVWQWLPFKATDRELGDAKTKKIKKLTAALSEEQLKKQLYLDNSKIDPTLNIIAVCKCINFYAKQMTEEFTGFNDSMHPGNLSKEERKKYGTEARTTDGAKMILPVRVPKDKFAIIMNHDLYKEITNTMCVSPYIKEGAYRDMIMQFLQWRIITIDTMPYSSFKLVHTDRYNNYDLYDLIKIDTLGQMLYSQYTAHRAIVFGIRKYQPAMYIKLTGVYVNPAVREKMFTVEDGTDAA